MGRIAQVIVILLVLGFLGLAGYAYIADLTPVQSEHRQGVTLPGGTSGN